MNNPPRYTKAERIEITRKCEKLIKDTEDFLRMSNILLNREEKPAELNWLNTSQAREPDETGTCMLCATDNIPLYTIRTNNEEHTEGSHAYGKTCPACTLGSMCAYLNDFENNTNSCFFYGCPQTLQSSDIRGLAPPEVVEYWATRFGEMQNANNQGTAWKNQWNSKRNLLPARNAVSFGCIIFCPYCLEVALMPRNLYACGYSNMHKCKRSVVSDDMLRLFPIKDNGITEYCLYCSRPAIDGFHYKNTLAGNTRNALQARARTNVSTYSNARNTNYLGRPDCGGPREMIARYFAVEDMLSRQMATTPETINTKAANNERAIFSQMHFPEFLDAADRFMEANPTIEANCGKEGKCETKEEEQIRLQQQAEFIKEGVPAEFMGGKRKQKTRRVKNSKRKTRTSKKTKQKTRHSKK